MKLSGKWNVVFGVALVVERDHRVFEAEQHPRIDLEREVQVDRAFAPLFGMEVDLPRLAQRVALDEVPLVVHVEAVLDRVVLEIGYESGDVDDCHVRRRAYRTRAAAPSPTKSIASRLASNAAGQPEERVDHAVVAAVLDGDTRVAQRGPRTPRLRRAAGRTPR